MEELQYAINNLNERITQLEKLVKELKEMWTPSEKTDDFNNIKEEI